MTFGGSFGSIRLDASVHDDQSKTTGKRLLMILVLLLFCGSAVADTGRCSAGGAILDQKNGFREARLGTPFSRFSHMQPTEQDQYKTKTVKAYERVGDNLEVFGQHLTHIVYYFFNNKLFRIRLEWADNADGSAILNGFGQALACPPVTATSDSGQLTALSVTGKSVFLRSEHRVVFGNRMVSLGWLHIERVGAHAAIQAQIQHEAASQF